jgi:BirA family biotin operon repressor/biotin-[acetyl-CoA-carboxylase] ligase
MGVTFSQQRFEFAYEALQHCDPLANVNAAMPVLQVLDQVASTNHTVWELLDQGAAEQTAVLALSQTAGKGQWGRQWLSAPGGLYLSAALAPELAVENAAQLTLCTAWGIARSLRQLPARLSGVADPIPVELKWPNDLVLEGRKLGGILTETRLHQGRIRQAVVGVGLNWTNPVPETGINLRSFLEQQTIPLIESLELLAALTLHGLLTGYAWWQQHGVEALLPAYLELLAHRDRPVVIAGERGTIVGITATGELRVQFASAASADGSLPTAHREVRLQPGTINLGYPL